MTLPPLRCNLRTRTKHKKYSLCIRLIIYRCRVRRVFIITLGVVASKVRVFERAKPGRVISRCRRRSVAGLTRVTSGVRHCHFNAASHHGMRVALRGHNDTSLENHDADGLLHDFLLPSFVLPSPFLGSAASFVLPSPFVGSAASFVLPSSFVLFSRSMA